MNTTDHLSRQQNEVDYIVISNNSIVTTFSTSSVFEFSYSESSSTFLTKSFVSNDSAFNVMSSFNVTRLRCRLKIVISKFDIELRNKYEMILSIWSMRWMRFIVWDWSLTNHFDFNIISLLIAMRVISMLKILMILIKYSYSLISFIRWNSSTIWLIVILNILASINATCFFSFFLKNYLFC